MPVRASVTTICGTGPLVACLNRNDPYHGWAVTLLKQLQRPMLPCEPVLTEAARFLREGGAPIDPLYQLLEHDALRLDFDMSVHWPRPRFQGDHANKLCRTKSPRKCWLRAHPSFSARSS